MAAAQPSTPSLRFCGVCWISQCSLVQSAVMLLLIGSLGPIVAADSYIGPALVTAALVLVLLHIPLIFLAKRNWRRAQQLTRQAEVDHLRENLELNFPAKEMLHTPGELEDLELGSSDACIICMEAFEAGDRYRELACRHTFHEHCIDAWWVRQCERGTTTLRCPTCRGAACDTHGMPLAHSTDDCSTAKEGSEEGPTTDPAH